MYFYSFKLVLLGDYDIEKGIFIKGPFYKVVKSKYPNKDILPRKGERIRLTVERNVVIINYTTKGTSDVFQPPWTKNILDEGDYTGVKILKGTIVEIRDVSMGSFPGMPAVLWVRVSYVPH